MKFSNSVKITLKSGILKQAQEYAEKEGKSLNQYIELALKRLISSYTSIEIKVAKPKKVDKKFTIVKVNEKLTKAR